jgi:mannose/cellobiose epimerase-like protein (N-acyl-D-glucosamine 2-epimerase family)
VPAGFGWLGPSGRPDPARVELWVTCRMTHVLALATLRGSGDESLVDHGVASLWGPLRDATHGGWFSSVEPASRTKEAYGHAFVVLAAASATATGRPGARALLDEALDVLDRFWDPAAQMLVDEWDEAFTTIDPYRGLNSNMHGVEALLAAHDVTGDTALLDRARAITERALGFASAHGWRLPEHFTEGWEPLLDYNRDDPAHPFRPYGGTVGHWFEWARLALQVGATAGLDLVAPAAALFGSGVRDGWHADGAPGFVYTVDWSGRPVVRQRMHWVAAEAVASAAALWRVTGREDYAAHHADWWAHVRSSFVDLEGGSWWHELSPSLEPAAGTWDGKPDVYHAFQATLLPRLDLAPSLATALQPGRPPDSASVVVPAGADDTMSALLDPDALVEWLPPDGMTGRFESYDARPGGSYRLVLTHPAGGGKTTDDTDVVDVRFGSVDPDRVVQEVDFESGDPAYAGTMRMTWSVLPAVGGSRVEATATGVPPGIDHLVHEAALRASLGNLAARLAR